MNFHDFKVAVSKQFDMMSDAQLYKVEVSKDDMWNTYLSSFPEDSNPMFRERRVHDCQCCKQFIRLVGNVICFIDGECTTIWDVAAEGGDPAYMTVATAMGDLIRKASIRAPFLHYEDYAGTDHNHGMDVNGTAERWEHFHVLLPANVVKEKDKIPTFIGKQITTKQVFKRALNEISMDALDTVLELIDQKSLYRGEENRRIIQQFRTHKIAYNAMEGEETQEIYCWECARATNQSITRIRNTAIGTLLVDLSEGKTLDAAVGAFETMMAGPNYKRPTALITQSMIKKAQIQVEVLGFKEALERRHAVPEDITIDNVLYADRNVQNALGGDVFDDLLNNVSIDIKKLSKVEEIDIDTFIGSVLPQVEQVELLMENRHTNNLMSLVAPVHPEANNMLMWDNNFSWTYNGEMADSMKQRVKEAGGNIEGVLRFSIQWNADSDNRNDYDAHCVEPAGGQHLYFQNMANRATTGRLDVDILHPGPKEVAVENITWLDEGKMLEGLYKLSVHNYSHRGGTSGFTAEIEYGNEIHSFIYNKELKQGEMVTVAEINYSHRMGIEFVHQLPSTVSSKEVWGVNTMQYQRVSMIMNSPNHWDGVEVGNKHLFFILEGCKQEGRIRGFYNEFLTGELREHRKVFEVLGSKMRVEESDQQLSGLGFSSTQRNHVFCRVSGSFARTLKIMF